MTSEASPDGGQLGAYTVRLELEDRPGELLNALTPISNHGGNLLSIFHERGNLTPRGHIPVEVDLECPADRFDTIVEAIRNAGVNVIRAGREHYSEELTVVLVGDLIETDLSDTLERIEGCTGVSVTDFSLAAPEGTEDVSSAFLRLAVQRGHAENILQTARTIADEKGLHVIEPLLDGDGETV